MPLTGAVVVGDVADEAGDVIAVGLVADAKAALEQLGRL